MLPRRKSPWTTLEPPERQFEGGVRLAEHVEYSAVLGQLVVGCQPGNSRRVDPMDPGERRSEIPGEGLAGYREALVTEQLPSDRLALHRRHDQVRRPEVRCRGGRRDDLGHRDTRRCCGPQERRLDAHVPVTAGALPLEDERSTVGSEAERLTGRATGQPDHVGDLGAVQHTRELSSEVNVVHGRIVAQHALRTPERRGVSRQPAPTDTD